jgi:hypothetical protein
LDLLWLRQWGVATQQHDETFAKLVDGACASQHGKLTDGAIYQRWTEALIDKLHKLRLGGAASIELHAVEPKLGIVEQVECREHHPFVIRCPSHMEELLATIQPWQWVAGIVEFGKLQFVRHGDRIGGWIARVSIAGDATAVGWRAWSAWRALGLFDMVDRVLQHLVVKVVINHHHL